MCLSVTEHTLYHIAVCKFYFSCTNIERAAITWCIVLSNCWHNLHLLSICVLSILVSLYLLLLLLLSSSSWNSFQIFQITSSIYSGVLMLEYHSKFIICNFGILEILFMETLDSDWICDTDPMHFYQTFTSIFQTHSLPLFFNRSPFEGLYILFYVQRSGKALPCNNKKSAQSLQLWSYSLPSNYWWVYNKLTNIKEFIKSPGFHYSFFMQRAILRYAINFPLIVN